MPFRTFTDPASERVGVPLDPALADLHHLRFKLALLFVWAMVSFGVSYFAEDLTFQMGPWPFSYWVAAQGGVLVFIVLTWVYCWAMRRFERQEDEPSAPAQEGVGPRG